MDQTLENLDLGVQLTVKRITFQTLGCKLNQIETDSLASQFRNAGYEITPWGEPTDVVVINTCTVTNKSDRKCRNIISQSVHFEPRPLVLVTGCYAENAHEDLVDQFGIDFLIPNNQKNLIFHLIDAHRKGEILPLKNGDVFDFEAHEKIFHTRAFLKIQDGCNHFCSYCIIPAVRGPAISRSLDKILLTAQNFLTSGAKELVLSGINIGSYQDGNSGLAQLITRLIDLDGDFRIRISSLEPESLTEEVLVLFDNPRLCRQLHLCLQSGSDRILKAMNRPYGRKDFAALTNRIRTQYPHFVLTTDLIVGFPGESEEDFEETLSSVEDFQFAQVHVFKYSRRTGTKADTMANQIPESQKTERSRRLQNRVDQFRLVYLTSFIGKTVRVLVEKVETSYCQGWSDEYLPVRFPSARELWNSFVMVKVIALSSKADYLLGVVISSMS